MAKEKSILECALYYYSLGWSIIPIGFNKKPPRGFCWKQYQTKRPDEQQLRKWFGGGKRNIAVIVGAADDAAGAAYGEPRLE